MNKDSKIYIAGHRGLVGSAILRDLKKKGYQNFVLRTSEELDLRDTANVESFFKSEKPEYVFLAAAKVGGIAANNTYRAEFIYDNLMIQNNIIHQSYLNNVKKLLFLGSTCIYPKNASQPMQEDSLLTGILEYTNEPYAIAKIAGMKMCESYNLQYGTNFISVMPTNLYGVNDNFDLDKSHVLPALIRKIYLGKCLEEGNWEGIRNDLRNIPIDGVDQNASEEQIVDVLHKYGIKRENGNVLIEIWGSGTPVRDFLWSEDMADACVYIMENRDFSDCIENNTEIKNSHLNIGTGVGVSIKELAYIIKDKAEFSGDFFFNKAKLDGTKKKVTDVTKLSLLGWRYKTEINEGVSKIFDWYQNRVN